MSEHLSPETWHPPLVTTAQAVERLVDRLAVEVSEEAEDYIRYEAAYPLPAGSLGLIPIGDGDVTFVKTISTDPADPVTHAIYIGSGRDVIFSLETFSNTDKLEGGYGDLGMSGNEELASEEVRPLITKLAAEVWLHEVRNGAPIVDEQVALVSLKRIVETLARPDDSFPDRERATTYSISPKGALWTSLSAERWRLEGDIAGYQLSVLDSYQEAIDLCIEGNPAELFVNNYAGSDIKGEERQRRIELVYSLLADAIAKGEVPEVSPIEE